MLLLESSFSLHWLSYFAHTNHFRKTATVTTQYRDYYMGTILYTVVHYYRDDSKLGNWAKYSLPGVRQIFEIGIGLAAHVENWTPVGGSDAAVALELRQ